MKKHYEPIQIDLLTVTKEDILTASSKLGDNIADDVFDKRTN